MTTRLPWLVVLLSGLVSACPEDEAPTRIQIYVQTDYGATVQEVRVDVNEQRDSVALARDGEMAFYLDAVGARDAKVDVTLRGVDARGNASTPQHTFHLQFAPERETVAVLTLSSHCPGGERDVGGDLPDRTSESGRDAPYSVCEPGILREGTWALRAGGSGVDSWQHLAVDRDGNVFAFGTFQGEANVGGTLLASDGAGDAYVAKYSPEGALVDIAQLGGTGDIESQSISLDGDGNPVVSGKFSGQLHVADEQPTAVGYDGFVLKLDFAKDQPALLWFNAIEGSNDQEISSVTFAADGALWIGGSFASAASDREGLCRDALHTQMAGMFVAQLDASSGRCTRATKVEGTGQCLPTRIAVRPSGAIVATCMSWFTQTMQVGDPSSPFVFPASKWANSFVAQFEPDLTLSWALSLGAGEACSEDGGAGVANFVLTKEGDVLVAGGYARCMEVVTPKAHRTLIASARNDEVRPFLLRIDATGALSESPFFAMPSEQGPLAQPVNAQAICMDAAGGFAVVGGGGSSFDFGLGERAIEGSRHAWVARYAADGTAMWGDAFHSGTVWAAHACAFDDAGNLFVSGDFTDMAQPSGAASIESKGNVDTYIVRYAN